jgi:WD40 repeat protein
VSNKAIIKEVIHQMKGHGSPIHSVAFSPNGKLVASAGGFNVAGSDTAIYLWEAATGKEIDKLRGHKLCVHSIAFSPDGKTLASGSFDKTVRLWNVPKGEEIRQLKSQSTVVTFSRDGKILVSGEMGGEVSIWDWRKGKELRRFRACRGHITAAALSPDGKTLATGTLVNNIIRLWDATTGKELLTHPGHKDKVLAVAISPDGKTMVSGGYDQPIWLWDLKGNKSPRMLQSLPIRAGWGRCVNTLAVSPDSELVAIAGFLDSAVRLWDVASGKRLKEFKDQKYLSCVTFAPTGQTLACPARDGFIRLWNAQTGKEIQRLRCRGVESIAFSPDGQTLASAAGDQTVVLWDLASSKMVRQYTCPSKGWENIPCLAFSPDGKMLAACKDTRDSGGIHGDGIYVWEVGSGALVHRFSGDQRGVSFVTFSPDGMTLAGSGRKNKCIRLWNVFTGKELLKLEGHGGAVYGIAFTPNGKQLASGSQDTTLLLWDVKSIERIPATKASAKQIAEWCARLTSKEAEGFENLAALIASGDNAVAWIKKQLKPVVAPAPKIVQRLIADLDHQRFAVRNKAFQKLAALEGMAEPAIRQALAKQPSADARRLLEALRLAIPKIPGTPEGRRGMRAILVLEMIGSPAAKEVLTNLSKGAPEALLTRDAKGALARLQRREANR